MPSILFFLEGPLVPASRFRALQFQPFLAQHGIAFKNLYTRPNKYLYYPPWLTLPLFKVLWAAASVALITATRFVQILLFARRYDIIFLQRDFLFRIPFPFIERFLFWWTRRRRKERKLRIVFDIDDAIFLDRKRKDSSRLRRKIAFIGERADLVLAGNDFLKEFFDKIARVAVVPTTIDTNRYLPSRNPQASPIAVGWTGSASTLPYLKPLEGVFHELQEELALRLYIITEAGAATPFTGHSAKTALIPWDAREEVRQLGRLDIGIMPLPDDVWARGKCGFKLLQYMSCAIPSVASPVGANQTIIDHGENGYLAATPQEWRTYLKRLTIDGSLRQQMGEKARIKVVQDFDAGSWFPRWLALLKGEEGAQGALKE